MPNDRQDLSEIEKQIEDGDIAADDPQVLDLISKLAGQDDAPASGDDSGNDAPGTDEEKAKEEAEAKAKADADARKQEEEKKAAKPEDGEKVILSKDGKHAMPYSVLEAERERSDAAEAAARQLAIVLQAAEKQIEALQAAKDGEEKPKDKTNELRQAFDDAMAEVESVNKEYPDIAPAQRATMKAMQMMAERLFGQLEQQQDTIDKLRSVAIQGIKEKTTTARSEAAEAISKVPALDVWRTKNPDLLKLAAKFDDDLKGDPGWKEKPMAERFQRAVEMVVLVKGPSVLDGIAPVQVHTKETGKKPSAADAIASALGITSLSDLPGGSAVSQVPGDVAGLSDSQLTEKISGLNDDQALFNFIANAVT